MIQKCLRAVLEILSESGPCRKPMIDLPWADSRRRDPGIRLTFQPCFSPLCAKSLFMLTISADMRRNLLMALTMVVALAPVMARARVPASPIPRHTGTFETFVPE